MNLTYQLNFTGYVIFSDGAPWINQSFDPRAPGFTPFESLQDAEDHAKDFIAGFLAPQVEAP